jgi:hypothetical protein
MPIWFLNGVVWVCAPQSERIDRRKCSGLITRWPPPAWSLHFALPHSLRHFREWGCCCTASRDIAGAADHVKLGKKKTLGHAKQNDETGGRDDDTAR